MMMSVPLWAMIVTQMCSNWAYYTLLTSLPTYMDNILHFDLKSVRLARRFCSQRFHGQIFLVSFRHVCASVLRTVSCPLCRTSVRL